MTATAKKATRKARRVRRAKRYQLATHIVNHLIPGRQPTKAQLDAYKKTVVDAEVIEEVKK